MTKIIWKWIKENFREYILVSLLFLIGIFIGVMIVNNCDDNQMKEISAYIQDFVSKFKNTPDVNKVELIGISIKNNLILALILWISGTTVVGLPIVLIVILSRGIYLGYTIATFSYALGKVNGILFCLISILCQNIFFIPAVLTLGVSSIKLYKSIVKDRDKQNIKIEILRHTAISGLMVGVLIFSSLIENIIYILILQNLIKYF